jgi:RNA polymerase sigma factor (sigma-70 family)
MADDTLTRLLQHLRLTADAARWEGASDGELLGAYGLRREEAAFAELMRRHGPMVFGVCRRVLGNEADAEDAFQATFAALAFKAAGLRRQPVGGWLHRVAARAARKARLRATRHQTLLRRAHTLPPSEPNRDATWEEVKPILDEELNRLPERARRLLVACYLQGKTHVQAAAEVGLPAGSVAWHMNRAREQLRSALVRRGVALSAAVLAALLGGEAVRAAVPAVLLVNTRAVATAFAAGSAETVPPRVAALAKATLAGLAGTGTRLSALVALGLALAGASLFAGHAMNAGRDAPPAADRAADVRTDLHGDPLPAGAVVRLGTVRLRHGAATGGVAFHPDGKHLLTAAGGVAVLWDAATGREVRRFGNPAPPGDNDPPLAQLGATALALSADGKTVALAYRQQDGVRVWEVETGRELHLFPGEEHGSGGLALSSDGTRLASAGQDGAVTVYDLTTGKETARLNRPTKDTHRVFQPAGLTFSPDGKLLAATCAEMANLQIRGALTLWDMTTGRAVWEVRPDTREPIPVATAFSPDGKTLAWDTTDGVIVVTEAATGRELRRLEAGAPCRFAYSPDGKSLVAALTNDRAVVVWDAATGQESRRIGKVRAAPPGTGWFGHEASPSVAVSSDGKTLAATGAGNTPWLIDLATGKDVFPAAGHQSAIRSIHYSADGKTIVTRSDDGSVRRWDAATGREAGRTALPHGEVTSPLSADGSTLATGTNDGKVRLWDTATGRQVCEVSLPPQGFHQPAVSPDGTALAVIDARQRLVRVYDRAGKEVRSFAPPDAPPLLPGMPAPLNPAKPPVFSPDGQRLAVRADSRVIVYSLATGREVGRVSFPDEQAAGGVILSPDGGSLALDHQDGTVGLCDVATGRERRVFGARSKRRAGVTPTTMGAHGRPLETFGLPQPSVPVAFSPDGRLLALAHGRAVTLWDVESGKEVARREGHAGDITAVAFAPDGKSLVTGSTDTTALVWDFPAAKR